MNRVLSLLQIEIVRLARTASVRRVRGAWRIRGRSSPIQPATISALAGLGYLAVSGDEASLTEAGRELLLIRRRGPHSASRTTLKGS